MLETCQHRYVLQKSVRRDISAILLNINCIASEIGTNNYQDIQKQNTVICVSKKENYCYFSSILHRGQNEVPL